MGKRKTTIDTYKVCTGDDGNCTISVDGTWMPGLFTSAVAAVMWVNEDLDELQAAWDAVRPLPLGDTEKPKNFVNNCFLMGRGELLFMETKECIYPTLDGYAIIPMEYYSSLEDELTRINGVSEASRREKFARTNPQTLSKKNLRRLLMSDMNLPQHSEEGKSDE